MTIKTKLIAHTVLLAAIIVAISLASYASMRFLQRKLSFLTEKSTPFQMRTIELQRELQTCITALVKVNAARSVAEYKSFRGEAETSLAAVKNTQKTLEVMGGGSFGMTDELETIAQELYAASEDRLHSSDAAMEANSNVMRNMKDSSNRLNDLDMSIRNLQGNYSKDFATALANTGRFSNTLRSIEDLRNQVRELQLIAVTVQNARNSSLTLIARGKLKAVTRRIINNEYFNSNKSIAAITSGFTDNLARYIQLQSVAIAQTGDDAKDTAAAAGKDISTKLNDLFQTLDQETMLVRDELTLATARQKGNFALTNSANSILVANSELVALGLMVTSETNRLFTVDSRMDLADGDSRIRALFTRIHDREQLLTRAMNTINTNRELYLLRSATAALETIYTEIYSDHGIMVTLRNKLQAIEQANKSADKLHVIVLRQAARGQEGVLFARSEQEKSISAVNNMVRSSLTQITGIGFAAICIGILFGIWIYRSVTLPLHIIRSAVNTQQRRVNEQATLATAVADGDLTRQLPISEPITLDSARINHDEMGMVLNAVVSMSAAQATLDRAFAGMTSALRTNKDEEARRDRLKSGLNELNTILRGEQNPTELADRALTYIATFLNAGVGIMFRYDDGDQMLHPLSTYAISGETQRAPSFKMGEGLPGQVAREQKMICLCTVPPDYLPITSALGKADPHNITIIPILHNNVLAGVLELGSFIPFSDDDITFLNQSLEGVAIALNVNNSRQMINELLEQMQTQSEELQAQQEELQQSNEELEERAQMMADQRRTTVKMT